MLAIAHRTPGDAGACAALVAAGAECFEIDVQLSARGVVVSHWLPVFGVRGWVERDGSQLRLHRTYSGDPSLADVLRNVPAEAQVLLDPKETRPDRRRALRLQLCEQLPDRGRFMVSTNDSEDLHGYRAAGFGTWRTVGDNRQLADVVSGAADVHDGLSIQQTLVTQSAIGRLLEVSPALIAWTVDTVARAAQLATLGLSGLTTNNPDVLSWVSSQRSNGDQG